MDQEGFLSYLRKSGRKPEVADRVIRHVNVFVDFLQGSTPHTLDSASPAELDAFVAWADQQSTDPSGSDEYIPSARSYLWALRYYYLFTGNENMAAYAALLREARIIRKPFALKDFRGVDPDHMEALRKRKIINIDQMLRAGCTLIERKELAGQTGIPEEAILELVRLSDLARIQGIKSIRARLYHDAGITSIKQFAAMQAEEILAVTRKFVEETGFDGIPPLPGEVDFSIKKAKSLPIVVEE